MPNKKRENEPLVTRIAEKIQEAMDAKNLSIRDVSDKMGSTYEHVRNIVRGNIVPSKFFLNGLCTVLGLNLKEMSALSTADRICMKYGDIPSEISGKNPEIEPIERAWPHMSEEHRKDLIAMAAMYAKRDKTEQVVRK